MSLNFLSGQTFGKFAIAQIPVTFCERKALNFTNCGNNGRKGIC